MQKNSELSVFKENAEYLNVDLLRMSIDFIELKFVLFEQVESK